ncbi:magnesium transporter CorA family protein [Clostridium mediterraneense]|uniref:magnesium transporter CorA family protein n=1 Tax=Clostridium mediterraneense TaxID=1805472 RepID=UPI0008335A45|nr:magnesium transporter CorA family protein [Clostridium mediterraneense]
MIQILKSNQNRQLDKIDSIENGCWINLINPTKEELIFISKKTNVELDFLQAALDNEETSRIDIEENYTLIILDIPFIEDDDSNIVYSTYPLGIIYTKEAIITISLRESPILNDFISNKISSFYTFKKFRFILQILYRVSSYYLIYLRQIEKKSLLLEKRLNKSMKNEELIKLHSLEKSLVYFSTSLKSNQLTFDKLLKLERIQQYEEDKDLLEDVIIENNQAIEMTEVYTDILSSTMSYFSSIISNNFNRVAKILTSVTIILTLFSVVASTYGMNIGLPLQNNPYAFEIVMVGTSIVAVLTIFILYKKNMLF